MRMLALIGVVSLLCGCAAKTICASGDDPFRSVLDPANSCKPRVRRVVIGSDIKMPPSIAIDANPSLWTYDWAESEFKNGQVDLGHVVLRPNAGALK